MRKRTAIIVLAVIVLVSFLVCCDGKVEMLEDGENVNLHIFPYLEFEPSEDGSSCVARVVEGARVTTVFVPARVEVDGEVLPVGEFAGFENPKDAVDLVRVELESSKTGIPDGAFSEATNFEGCVALNPGVWGRLPSYENDSERHFLGWFAGGKKVEEGMAVDPDHPHAAPKWERHDLVHHDGKEPTCAEGGWEAYDECSVCHWNNKAELPALGHQPVHVEAKAATCEEDGNIEHWKCDRCGKFFTDSGCVSEITEAQATVPKLGHDYTYVAKREPTCTEEGWKEHWHCARCHKDFIAGEDGGKVEATQDELVLEMIPHAFSDEWKHDWANHWHECGLCGERKNLSPHTWDEGTVTRPPTESKPGEMRFQCAVCGRVRTEDIPPEEADQYEVVKVVAPTCVKEGYTICQKKGEPDKQWKTDITQPLGHILLEHPRKEATCAVEGNIQYWECNRDENGCGHTLFSDKYGSNPITLAETVIPKTDDHNWTQQCDESDHWMECSICSEVKDKGPHVYDQEVVSNDYIKSGATCESPAVYYKSCVCGQKGIETFKSGEPLGHDLEHIEAKEATCVELGNIEHWRCKREAFGCGHKLFVKNEAGQLVEIAQEDTVMPLKAHEPSGNYEIGEEGHRPICKVCNKGYGPWQSHDEAVEAHDATTHWRVCSVCGTRTTEPEPHDWEIIGDRRCCKVCGYVAEKDMPSGGFDVSLDTGEPEGELDVSNLGTKFTFVYSDKEGYEPAVTFEWYVDDVLQEGEASSSFVLDATLPTNYVVRCVFSTADGCSASLERQVIGGEAAHPL